MFSILALSSRLKTSSRAVGKASKRLVTAGPGLVMGFLLVGSLLAGPRANAAEPAPAETPTPGGPMTYRFPVQPASATQYGRAHHDYPATDIFAPKDSLFVSPVAGRIDELSSEDHWTYKIDDPALRGGRFVSILGDDGVRYYGSHLDAVAAGLVAGMQVQPGQILGYVGNFGQRPWRKDAPAFRDFLPHVPRRLADQARGGIALPIPQGVGTRRAAFACRRSWEDPSDTRAGAARPETRPADNGRRVTSALRRAASGRRTRRMRTNWNELMTRTRSPHPAVSPRFKTPGG